jgi:hypothetical protein
MSPFTVVVIFVLTVLFVLIGTVHLLFNKTDVDSAGISQKTKTA